MRLQTRGERPAGRLRCLSAMRFAIFALLMGLMVLPVFAAQSAADIVDRANGLYRNGHYKQAIILYRKAMSRGADPIAVSFNVANSYYQMEQYPEAAASYRKAVDFSNGKFAPALFNMASVFYRLKQYPECVAAYHRALKLEPDNVSAWLFLGEAYSRTGDKVGALSAIEKAYQLDKSDISVVYQLSEANIALDDYESAIAVIREGYANHPEEVDFLVYLGDVFRLKKDFEQSAGAYREALSVRPDDTATMYKLADVLVEDDKPFVAMDILTNVLQIKPDFADAAIFLGNLAYDAHFWERSESAYEMAAKAGSDEAVYGFKNLAFEARGKKRTDEALRLLEKAQGFYPKDQTLEAEILELRNGGE